MESHRYQSPDAGTPQYPHSAPAARSRPSPGPPIQTQNLRQNPRFSWQQTPVQQSQERFPMHEQYASPATTIDESPLSGSTAQPMTFPPQQQTMGGHGSPYPEEKAAPVSPQQQVHPAHFAPYADADLRDQHLPYADEQKHHGYSHSRSHSHSQSQPQHPQYQQPHPQQHQHQQPRSPPSTRPTTQFPSAITIPPIPTDPQTSLDAKHHTTPRTPTYTPHSPFGPNSTLPSTFPPPPNAHLPGQIPHPNASASPTWSSSLLTCDTLCLHALFSPCTLYSLTSHRLAQKRAHKDPTNLLSHSACDGNAWFYGLTCGLCGVLACLERGRVRRGYGIRGGMLGDALRGCCCACCVVGQAEREVRGREERWRANEGPGSGAGGYVMEGGMRYEPPPRG